MSFQHLTELLDLCQRITADKRLSKAELGALRDWLQHNKDADIPMVGLLREALARIVKDGVVSPKEHAQLIETLESIARKLRKK